jgi:acetolactate synthase-1/2/3 large subunit
MSGDALPPVDRRRFLAGLTVGAAAAGATTVAGSAQAQAPAATARTVPVMSAAAEAKEPEHMERLTTDLRSGADFVVDVMKALDIKYVASNCASSFRGLQESIINYGGNAKPEWLTCMHEEISTAMAHGYFKITGKPMISMVHAVVGVQHASMAIYNAFCDRAGVIVVAGNSADANTRRPGVEWRHSSVDQGAMVRDYTKWDDQPASLQHASESMVRAYQIAAAAPEAPVLLSIDSDMMEKPIEKHEEKKLMIPKLGANIAPQGDVNALREAARLLVAAESPVIVADMYARTNNGPVLLAQLAELLQAPVVDLYGRLNMPTQHWLQQSRRRGPLLQQADVILALDPSDIWALTHDLRDQLERSWSTKAKAGMKMIEISTLNLRSKGNIQDIERFSPADLSISGAAESSMPTLIEEVQKALSTERKTALAARGQKLQAAWKSSREQAYAAAAAGWDSTPVSTARVTMELWDLIKNDDWGFGGAGMAGGWDRQFWKMEKRHHYSGGSGGAGLGWNLPSSIGSALANRDEGRYTVAFQRDGDSLYAPAALWTAAHHKIPLLSVVHNNRAWHQEVMHIQRVAYRHNRGLDRYHIGTTITDPYVDFAKVAEGFGMFSVGPITDPKDVRPALQKALAVVKRGEPALVDIVMQPR